MVPCQKGEEQGRVTVIHNHDKHCGKHLQAIHLNDISETRRFRATKLGDVIKTYNS